MYVLEGVKCMHAGIGGIEKGQSLYLYKYMYKPGVGWIFHINVIFEIIESYVIIKCKKQRDMWDPLQQNNFNSRGLNWGYAMSPPPPLPHWSIGFPPMFVTSSFNFINFQFNFVRRSLLRSNLNFNFVKLSFTFVFCQSNLTIQHSNSSIVTEICPWR